MKILKILLTSMLLVFFVSNVSYAKSENSILRQNVNLKQVTGYYPVLDGLMDETKQNKVNLILKKHSDELLKKVNNKGMLNFSIEINEPSVFSVLIKVTSQDRTFFDAVNIDVSKGEECQISDFFYLNEHFYNLIGKDSDVLFSKNGLYFRKEKGDFSKEYSNFIEYKDFLSNINIVNAARFLPVFKATDNIDNKVLSIKEGEILAIKIETNRSTGYSWEVSSNDKDAAFEIGRSFLMSRVDKTDFVGKPDYEIIFLGFNKSGNYNLNLIYKRPWEKFGDKNIGFKVVVEEKK